MNKPEQKLQEWYALWLRSKGVLYCASLGGRRVSIGVATAMKRAGYRKGYPDMIIEEPRAGWGGMRVELKIGQYPSPEQKIWHRQLRQRNIYAVIMPANMTYQQAATWIQDVTERYLEGKIKCPNK